MSISGAKKSRGRPPVDTEAVNVRMTRQTLRALDDWIDAQPEPKPSRPAAVRAFVEAALHKLGKP